MVRKEQLEQVGEEVVEVGAGEQPEKPEHQHLSQSRRSYLKSKHWDQ